MALNVSMIYRRTDHGVREVYEKSHQFTQSERLILILLDGRLNVAGLKTRLPSLNDERIERAMRKLQDAGLVEQMGLGDPSRGNGAADASRLSPEAVAHFLEQSELDPVTSFGDTKEAVAADLVRARIEQAAAQLMREESGIAQRDRERDREKDRERSATVRPAAKRNHESGRSHDSRLTGGQSPARTTQTELDAVSTHFAITTVNVPDRLDLQEERDRAELESYPDDRRRIDLRAWMKRLIGFAFVAVLIAAGYSVVQPLRSEVSPARVSERLTTVFKRPVTVDDTEFRFSPTPRMIMRGIGVGDLKVDEASLLINWKDLWSAIRGGNWVWSEGTVAPLSVTTAQAAAVALALPGGANALPSKISTLRFESVRISDSELLAGRYEGLLRRGDDGKFGPLVMRQIDTEGAMRLTVKPVTEDGRAVLDFRLDAERWSLPFGPKVRWNEVIATGRLDEKLLEVKSYTLTGFYGAVSGQLFAARDVEWVITGTAVGSNLDVEAILQSMRSAPAVDGAPPSVAQGTASLSLVVFGRGSSLDDAVSQAVIAGPFQVRWATLNGINLGLAATQGATAAGITRFTEFDGVLGASLAGVRFENTGGRSGVLSARGDFTVAPDQGIAGMVRVELGGQRIQAPITLRIRGTALTPRFGP